MRWGAGAWLIRPVLKTGVLRKVDREFESHPHRFFEDTMSRVDCLDGTQRELIEDALEHFPNLEVMADVCRVHPRTLRDWRREKHRMSYESLKRVYQHAAIPLPAALRLLPDFWHIQEATRLGGRRRAQRYGPPGTLESRRKGGQVSIKRFQANPQRAKALGFVLRKRIKQPRKSALLAEFVGIMLGDGCLSGQFQVGISFNSKTDGAYGTYLQNLFRALFGVSATIQRRTDTNGWTVVASSRALVEYLQVLGLVCGDKVANQVDLPHWIWVRRNYQTACLRGLMDTDGSVYRYTHRVNDHTYNHVALCFTNHSMPLLRSVECVLRASGFSPRTHRYHVYLNRQQEIERYFRVVGTKNAKHLTRFQRYLRYSGGSGEVRESG